jgi:diguanylate cyclase (GGDEF)-like protein
MDRYRLAVSGERHGLWDWDLVSDRVHFSPRWIAMVGGEDGEIGSSPEEWLRRVHTEDQPRVRGAIEAHLASDAPGFAIRHRMGQRDGSYRWMLCRAIVVRNGEGRPVRLVGSHTDVTGDHVADPLTGLPNRELFADRLTRAIDRAARHPGFLYAVLLIDLDQSSPDVAAPQAERDPLLTTSARRIEAGLRGTVDSPFPGTDSVVARLRHAQFAVLLEGLGHIAEAQVAAERVLAGLLVPLQVQGRQLFPRASIGIAVSATGYTSIEDVMRDADAALYRARSLGGNRCEVFDLDLVQTAETRLALEVDLQHAIERGQFLLFYQPVVEAVSGQIVGVEALARWNHPTRGMVPPRQFIPIAESTGFIVSLEQWTLREACRQLKIWQASLPIAKDFWISVNVSGVHFRQPGIVERVGTALGETGVDGKCLVLELTESVVMDDPAAVRTLLMQLRVMGVRIGIDDFGTGHSSFAYLHQIPADFLKVDQSFVRGMEVRPDKADIVGTLVELAGQLGLRVIVEGIESETGLELVRSRHCEYVQGFLFSEPVGADAAAALLTNGVNVPTASSSDRRGAPAAPLGVQLRQAGRWLQRHVTPVLATVAIAISIGLAGRFTREPDAPRPSPPPRPVVVAAPIAPLPPPSRPNAVALAQPAVTPASPADPGTIAGEPSTAPPTPATPSLSGVDGAGSAGAVSTEPAGAKHESGAPQPAVVTLAVEHQHVFGGCKGVLRVSSSGVSFTADNAKDTFEFEPGRFESALGGDALTIKDGRRTYRFKVAPVARQAERQPALRDAMNAITTLQAK